MTSAKVKGVGLLSGGLDSTLAVKVLQDQDVEILCVTFTTLFFGAEPGIQAGRRVACAAAVRDAVICSRLAWASSGVGCSWASMAASLRVG